jgi:hypothetical protein
MKAQRESRGMTLLILNFGVRWDGWSTEQNPVTHCRGGRLSPRASLDGCGKDKVYSLHLVSNPNHPAPATEMHQHTLTFSMSGNTICAEQYESERRRFLRDLHV